MSLPGLSERLIQPTIEQLHPSEMHVRDREIRIDFQGTSKRRSCFRQTTCVEQEGAQRPERTPAQEWNTRAAYSNIAYVREL